MVNFDKVKTVEELVKLVEGGVQSAKLMRDKVHISCMAVLKLVAMDEREEAIKQANYLMDNLGSGIRLIGLTKWFVQIGNFQFSTSDNAFIATGKPKSVKDIWEKAMAKPWHEFNPKQEPKAYDFEALAERLIANADKMIAERNAGLAEEASVEQKKRADEIHIDEKLLEAMRKIVKRQLIPVDDALAVMEAA